MVKRKSKKGTALIVAVLLAAIVGSTVAGVSAIAIRQVKTAATYNNGLMAFYAAESGLQEGLLRYKFNSDAQIPTTISNFLADSNPPERLPSVVYRTNLSTGTSVGASLPYLAKTAVPTYDLQVYWQQKYFGDDRNGNGYIDAGDIAAMTPEVDSQFEINKDNSATFSILADPAANNNIYLYWRWLATSCNNQPRALEIKIKTAENNGVGGENLYTGIFRDNRQGCGSIANSTDATVIAGRQDIFTVPGIEVKSALGISAKTAIEMTLRPVGNTATSGDGILFGFNQGPAATPNTSIRTTGPTTTINSIGYYMGTSRQITADISRQSGTILDLFNNVIYKGK